VPIHICNRACRRRGCSGGGAAPAADQPTIPAFYFDQDQGGQPTCFLTHDLAVELKRLGRGKFICHGKKFRFEAKAPRRAADFFFIPSESVDSSASISLAEIKANVGITEDEAGTPVPRHIVQRARQKIRAIGMRLEGSFDSRAPLAFGSRPVYPKQPALLARS
jgi:hypothetical protein